MKKFNHKNALAIFFLIFIFVTGVLTIALNPMKIIGGFGRGYVDGQGNTLQKIGNGFTAFEDRENEYYALHDQFINAFGAVQNVINSKLIYDADESNNVVKLKNGYLTFKQTEELKTSDLTDYLTNLKNKYENVNFLYVNKASKDTTDKDLLPDNYPYTYPSDIDKTMADLKSNGIDVLDIEESITTENLDKYSLFFKTDHHWKPSTGIWVSKLISENLNQNFSYNIDLEKLNIENYNVETYENSFLGSQGKRIGKYYAGTDDFDIIYPKFDTNFTITTAGKEAVTGDFEKTMLHRENLTPNNLLNKDTTAYDVYMEGNHSLVKIQNNNNLNGKKALLVLDSYGVVIAPYLAQSFSQLDCIDIRSYKDSVDSYIAENAPDVVIYSITGTQK